jgi:hypothetical protein
MNATGIARPRMAVYDVTERVQGDRSRRIAIAAAVLVVLLALLWLWSQRIAEQDRALEQLPAAERRALYERTLHTLERSCAPRTRPAGLDDYCRQQAEFIVRFPECDQACRTVAEQFQKKPTR